MKCKLCKSQDVEMIYNGTIRNGGLKKFTDFDVPMYQCNGCGVIWHENTFDNLSTYYESPEYRSTIEGNLDEEQYFAIHDKDSLQKFIYTGTDIFRNKKVCDVGCAMGYFLDFISGVANEIIAIEPSEKHRTIMSKKGYTTFPYIEDAIVTKKIV